MEDNQVQDQNVSEAAATENNENETFDLPSSFDEMTEEDFSAMTEAFKQMETELAESKNQLQELTSQLESKTTELDSFAEKINDIAKALGIVQEETSTAEGDEATAALQEKVTSLEAEVQTLTNENTELNNQLAEFQSQNLKGMAEQIVGLRLSLGDIKEDQKEAEFAKFASRTQESLRDTLADLEDRAASGAITRVVEKIKNPSMVDATESNVEVVTNVEEFKEKEAKKPQLNEKVVFKNLLTSKR